MISGNKVKILLFLVILLFVLVSDKNPSAALDYEPPAVLIRVYKTVTGPVSSTQEYIGLVEAMQTVDVRPEVNARITKVHFKEGSFVKAGETLFTLNSAQFSANVALRKAEVSRAEANLDKAKKYLSRLRAADRRSVPESDMDTANSEVRQAQAAVAEAKASLQISQIDLNNTRIKSPISGIIGKTEFTAGNYVAAGTDLARIVQVDPVRISFSMPDRDYVRNRNSDFRYSLRLSDGSVFDHEGSKDFVNNTMNSDTGTIKIWLRFDNTEGILVPGALVKVLLTTPEQYLVLVPQSAVLAGRDGEFVYVIKDGRAHVRKVTTGPEKDNLCSVISGLQPGELIASEGIQSLIDGVKVIIQDNTER